eukprot:GEMP01036538.1.p1 GENE.GEMP01036538.1~~GEMP01036538.1.p1  ORF type:complete len:531 (+),score=115.89 GEMP01036538.1:143-1735(+)
MTAQISLLNGVAPSSLGDKIRDSVAIITADCDNYATARLQSDVNLDAFRQIARSIDERLQCRKHEDTNMILNLQNVKRNCSVLSKKLELGEKSATRPARPSVEQLPPTVTRTALPSAPKKRALGPFRPRTRAPCAFKASTVASSWLSRAKNSTPMVCSPEGVAVPVKPGRSRSTSSRASSVADRRQTVPAESRRSLRVFPGGSPPPRCPAQDSIKHRAPRVRIPTLPLSNPQGAPATPKQIRSPSPAEAGKQIHAAHERCSKVKEKLEAEEQAYVSGLEGTVARERSENTDLRRQLKEAQQRCQMLEEKIRCQEKAELELKQTLSEERKVAKLASQQKDEPLTPMAIEAPEGAGVAEEELKRERREKEELQKSMTALQSTLAITKERCRSLKETSAAEQGALRDQKELELALASERSQKEEICNRLREAKEFCDAMQQQVDMERHHNQLNAEWWLKSQEETRETTFGLQEAWQAEKEAMMEKYTKLKMDLELVSKSISASEASEDKLRDEISGLQLEVANLRSTPVRRTF